MKVRVLGAIAPALLLLTLCSCGGGAGSTSVNQQLPPSSIPRSPIRHLIVVVMQNNSFDHLFGTYPGADGLDPTLASYTQVDSSGNPVHPQLLTDLSPADLNHTRASYLAAYDSGKMDEYASTNGAVSMDYYDNSSIGTASDGRKFGVDTLWNYAQQYALADNFFAAAMASEPANMLYFVAAYAGSGTDPYGYPQLDACTAGLYQQNKGNGATITPPLTFQNVGDQLSANKISWTFFQEWFSNEQNGTCTHYVPQENPFQYFQSTANSANIQNFTLTGFTSMLSAGTLPSVVWVQPSPGHSMHPGQGNIANSIEWLDDFVQTVKGSQIWSNTAIIVLWDESGGWYDHVAPPQLSGTIGLGARVPVILISTFAKKNYISHQRMDLASVLRFIQWNWGLGPFTDPTQAAREQQSADICDLLTTTCSSP
ncbi:MAG TPA: alkaline phosphatase family protein [Terriglobales bacterium]|nr:alkaline phosphatase family protein [Terriglobales bacterium]